METAFSGKNLSSKQMRGGILQQKLNKWYDLPKGILLHFFFLCVFP